MADRPPTPTAAELMDIVEAERTAVGLGWADRCDYVGLGGCVRAAGHDLPHLTDPSTATPPKETP